MPDKNPKAEYLQRLQLLDHAAAQQGKQDKQFAIAKLLTGIATLLIAGWLIKFHSPQIAFLFLPLAIFILLFVLHERVLRRLRRCTRLQDFYRRGLGRVDDRWHGIGEAGEQYLDPTHPYARDLDLFGKGGLFELLCTTRTRAGQQTLASWLLTGAPVQEVQKRQTAVQELAARLDFRERLALAGEDFGIGVQPDALIAWSQSKVRLTPAALLHVLLPALAAAWLLSLAAWFVFGWSQPALLLSLINFGITYKLHARTTQSTAEIEKASHDLALLSQILKEIEREKLQSPLLTQLQQGLKCGDTCPSNAIEKLQKRVAWLESNDNWFVKLLNLFTFWAPLYVIAIEAWRARYGVGVPAWIAITGEVEALAALGSYCYEHPGDTFPEFTDAGPLLHAEALAHPLLPRGRAIANDIALGDALQLMLVSGPNMAGKSTFIRSVGINVVLAQAGAPVCATRLVLSPLQVAASICILDSLQGGLSRFYAEIMRLKTVDDLSMQPTPVLFLLDELLSGTNSHDRRIGTESLIRSLLARGAIGLVTTHDLALAEIVGQLDGHAANFHFTDTFENGRLHFSYRLTPGIVQTTNALELMRSIGLNV